VIARSTVAVVGGGPSGATCASRLARRGFSVTLIESRESSEKPCGGGIPGGALPPFPEIGDASLPRRVVRRIVLLSPSGRRAVLEAPRGIHVFRRLHLDAHLRRHAVEAGANLIRTRATKIRPLPGSRWEVLTEAGVLGPFDHLVGADGVNGVVRRSLGLPYGPSELTLAVFAYLQGRIAEEIVLKFFGDLDGYLWIFPRSDHLSVGACASHAKVTAARLEDELARFVESQVGVPLPSRIRGYFIPASDAPAGASSGPSWALIGDAGGFVDPLTREGIAPAMRSAIRLADHLAEHGAARTPHLPGDLRLARRYARGFYERRFLETMTRLAAASGSIRRVFGDLFSGSQGYTGLKTRLLLNAVPCGLEAGLSAFLARSRQRASPFQ